MEVLRTICKQGCIVLLLISAFTFLNDIANAARGYCSVGGEICIIFIPLLHYIIKSR